MVLVWFRLSAPISSHKQDLTLSMDNFHWQTQRGLKVLGLVVYPGHMEGSKFKVHQIIPKESGKCIYMEANVLVHSSHMTGYAGLAYKTRASPAMTYCNLCKQ